MFFHTSAAITMFSARNGCENHARYSSCSPSWVSAAFTTPYCALNMYFHIAALTIVGSAHGSTTIVRNSQRARSGALSSSAMPRPRITSSDVETAVKYSVRRIEDQNSGWCSAVV